MSNNDPFEEWAENQPDFFSKENPDTNGGYGSDGYPYSFYDHDISEISAWIGNNQLKGYLPPQVPNTTSLKDFPQSEDQRLALAENHHNYQSKHKPKSYANAIEYQDGFRFITNPKTVLLLLAMIMIVLAFACAAAWGQCNYDQTCGTIGQIMSRY